jgi:flavodoxin short chain
MRFWAKFVPFVRLVVKFEKISPARLTVLLVYSNILLAKTNIFINLPEVFMKKVLVVYWSGGGNTEAMAKAVAAGAEDGGAEVTLKAVGEVTAEAVKDAGALAFGCPAMGDEALEEDEMEPFIAGLSQAELGGKPLGLFGSYDWGDGQWMRTWAERMKGLGVQLDGEGIIAQLEPDESALSECRELGKRLAG